MEKKVAVVAGASGIVGRGLVEHLATLDDWDVIGLAREAPADESRVRFHAVDLLDAEECRDRLGGLSQVTHVFYAAYQERSTEAEQVTVNPAMLRNLVAAIEDAAPGLEHVSLIEGVKAYGRQFGPFKTPAKETDPRHMPPNFYITNGDYFRWEHLWPGIAEGFGMEAAPPMPIPLAAMMADKGPLWDNMVKRHGLRPYRFEQIASWRFAEFVFRIDYDVISDTTKARQFGFHDVVETPTMFDRIFADLRDRRYVP